jgi:predicted transcriptional regulator of viral defense system
MAVASLNEFIDNRLLHGFAYFDRKELLSALGFTPERANLAIARLLKKRRLANPRHGFYLILRPEDQAYGSPDPSRWINPLMKHQGVDYRISLLRAAGFHGSSHQAAMVFQVIAPVQLRDIEIGRHRIQFVYQSPKTFEKLNLPEFLEEMKTDAGYAKVAGAELTLLDCARYFHKASGLNGVAQIVKDIGAKANPRILAKAAAACENATVRRLGYLLDRAGHARQAKVLESFAKMAKTPVLLDPSITPLSESMAEVHEKDAKWKLLINDSVEIDF